ncbi:MAG: plasmid stabilization protein [Proteobacteria bacterium]|nr:MAG: plasmid stabilization protein [Pseudomonadota bacterium]
MIIKDSDRFINELIEITTFIAIDSLDRAMSFEDDLKERMEILISNPYAFRKSTKFNDECIRDFIFKGYTIPYLIDGEIILVLGIYKANDWN